MKRVVLLLLVAISMQSCATILTGGKSTVSINTPEVEETLIYVNGIEKGHTPLQLKLKADDVLTFEKNGYARRDVIVDSKFNAVSIINLFSILGWGIDAATGAIKVPDTKVYNITLKEKQ